MSALSRSRAASSLLRPCLASTSRLTRPVTRAYATPADSQTSATEEYDYTAHTFGTTAERKAQGAEIRRYNGKGQPTLNSTRHRVSVHHPHLWNGSPLKELTIPLRRKGGRDTTGQIVVRHIGGGHKRRLRTVDFFRYVPGIHDVIRIEYDPGRSAHIALLRRREYAADVSVEEGAILAEKEAGESGPLPQEAMTMDDIAMPREAREYVKAGWSYILAPDGLRAGDQVRSFRTGIPPGLVEGWGQAIQEEEQEDEPGTQGTPSGFGPDAHRLDIATINETSNSAFSSSSSSSPSSSVQAIETTTLKSKFLLPVDPSKFDISPRALGLLRTVTLKPGNVLPLYLIPPGTIVHNISFNAMGKMKAVRSAGSSAQIVAHQGENGEALGGTEVLKMGAVYDEEGKVGPAKGVVLVKMTSGEVRKFSPGAVATIGTVSNKEHQLINLGKAGRARWLGRRPTVRGVAMNAHDHPHGGGKGKSKGGKQSHSYSGKKTRGVRTRRSKDKHGNKAVVTERPRGPHSGNKKR